uniref:Uncharacterized protein n=1 Tax=Alexandrium catenella TaxID=2925 RepID=A0A7S1WMJ8_ALECA
MWLGCWLAVLGGRQAGRSRTFVAPSPSSGPLRQALPPRGRARGDVSARFFLDAIIRDTPEKQLLQAAQQGDTEEVSELLGKGADPNAPVGSGGATPLMMAAINGHAAVVRALIMRGAAPDVALEKDGPLRGGGATALFLAAQQGHEEVVEALLDLGANATAVRGDGASPLDVAERKGHEGVASILRKATSSAAEDGGQASEAAEEP